MRAFAGLVDRAAFRPSRHPIDCAKERRILDAPWGPLEAVIEASGEGGDPAVFVLRFLGARGRAENGTTDPLNRHPRVRGRVWIVNPPGFGASAGPVSLARYADAALLVFDAMAREAAGRRIWVQGQSLGTLAALRVAAERPVDLLILRNVTPVHAIVQARCPPGTGWLGRAITRRIPAALDAHANASRSSAPALFVASAQDRLATTRLQRAVFDRYGGPKLWQPVECRHDDHVLLPHDEARYADLTRQAMVRQGLLGE